MSNGHPQLIVPVNHIEPVPRRIRATLAGRVVLDTTRALYVWETPHYPQYYVPFGDLDPAVVVDEEHLQRLSRGTARRIGLHVGDVVRPGAGRVYTGDAVAGLPGMVRLDWDAADAWFEEDEEVFVHPRSPYTRVDALRSSRHVRVEVGGVLLAESAAPVLVFETGLPTRYYLSRTAVDFTRLSPSPTRTACPYKGLTSAYWSFEERDVAWSYDFPTVALAAVAGLVAFYDERVDVQVQ